jgi:hypothetical protein
MYPVIVTYMLLGLYPAHFRSGPGAYGAQGAIYEQYYGAIQGSCGRDGDEGQDD